MPKKGNDEKKYLNLKNKKWIGIILLFIIFCSSIFILFTHTSIFEKINWKVVIIGNLAIIASCFVIFIIAFIIDLSLPARQKKHENKLNSIAQGWNWIESGTKKKISPATVRNVIEYGGRENLSSLRGPQSCRKIALFIGILLWIAIIILCGNYLVQHNEDSKNVLITCTITFLLSIILVFLISLFSKFISNIFPLTRPFKNEEFEKELEERKKDYYKNFPRGL